MGIPRPEYPRPQFVRRDWLCLNGEWEFEIDAGDSGLERGLRERPLSGRILVPFCPESRLSGIGNTDFLNAVWYRREVEVPAAWAGRDVLLHFGAIDYDATVWVNGREAGRHRGGFTPFACDLSGIAAPGQKTVIVVRARDLKGMSGKPGGKQSLAYANADCHYTRTTGIWQTVWLEPVPRTHLRRPRLTPDVGGSRFILEQPLSNSRAGTLLHVTLTDGSGTVCRVRLPTDGDFTPVVTLPVPAERQRLWSPQDPFLYGLEIELLDARGSVVDQASAYCGLRSVTIAGGAVKINGQSVFQRLVLDQGYYPDGILTAPDDAALRRDIELAMAAGFNGARLHQKVFEERFLYHADRLGYLVWGEFGDWGIDRDNPKLTCVGQWLEALERDYSHPSIVGWCPLNETAQPITGEISALDDLTRALYLATKAADRTRPVLDASGYSHRIADADVYDSHDYDQNPDSVRQRHAGTAAGKPFVNGSESPDRPISVAYRGQPYFVSEFGGIWWNPRAAADEPSWGYGERPRDIEEFHRRFAGLCDALLDNPGMFGYCYTQLTDVFQEQNGIFFFDRSPKFDLARLRRVQNRRAAMETPAGQGK